MKNLNIFETNDFSKMKIIDFEGTKIYHMDNFYKNPYLVLEYLNSIEPPVWKSWETPSRNMIDFEDRRHQLNHEGMDIVYQKLSNLCGQLPVEGPNVITNYTRFKKNPNNNYNKNYWWPHNDSGYNGIIYLNDYGEQEYEGTFLYKLLNKQINTEERASEHEDPWTPKEYWDIIIKISAKFNRFVMFEGSVYLHGMSIFDNRWFAENLEDANFRINQVLFFDRQL
jgi:hypothetical protein